jgi:tetratricopeptide (TPR) repeat protein
MIAAVRLFAVAGILSLLAACAGPTVSSRHPPVTGRSEPPAPVVESYPYETPTAPPVSVPDRAPAPSSPAVVALVERADSQYVAQDLDAAAASLERALRIEPRNPRLWQRLAAVRLDQGQYDQAIQMAAKSNSLAAGSYSLQARNWQLIATARRAKGDLAGAQSAEQKARQFE